MPAISAGLLGFSNIFALSLTIDSNISLSPFPLFSSCDTASLNSLNIPSFVNSLINFLSLVNFENLSINSFSIASFFSFSSLAISLFSYSSSLFFSSSTLFTLFFSSVMFFSLVELGYWCNFFVFLIIFYALGTVFLLCVLLIIQYFV